MVFIANTLTVLLVVLVVRKSFPVKLSTWNKTSNTTCTNPVNIFFFNQLCPNPAIPLVTLTIPRDSNPSGVIINLNKTSSILNPETCEFDNTAQLLSAVSTDKPLIDLDNKFTCDFSTYVTLNWDRTNVPITCAKASGEPVKNTENRFWTYFTESPHIITLDLENRTRARLCKGSKVDGNWTEPFLQLIFQLQTSKGCRLSLQQYSRYLGNLNSNSPSDCEQRSQIQTSDSKQFLCATFDCSQRQEVLDLVKELNPVSDSKSGVGTSISALSNEPFFQVLGYAFLIFFIAIAIPPCYVCGLVVYMCSSHYFRIIKTSVINPSDSDRIASDWNQQVDFSNVASMSPILSQPVSFQRSTDRGQNNISNVNNASEVSNLLRNRNAGTLPPPVIPCPAASNESMIMTTTSTPSVVTTVLADVHLDESGFGSLERETARRQIRASLGIPQTILSSDESLPPYSSLRIETPPPTYFQVAK